MKLDKHKVLGYKITNDMESGYSLEEVRVIDFIWWYNHNRIKRKIAYNWISGLVFVTDEVVLDFFEAQSEYWHQQNNLETLYDQYKLPLRKNK